MRRSLLITAMATASLFAFLAIVPSAYATVLDYHNYVQGLGDTILQYDFDGSTDTARLGSKVSSNNLLKWNTPTLGVAGFDSTSSAFSANYSTTSGLYTSNAITLPASGASVEGIYRKTGTDLTSTQYVIGAYSNNVGGNTARGYFSLVENGIWQACAGSNYAGRATGKTVVSGNWVYMATSMSYNDTSNKTTIDLYMADLTAGDTTLTKYSAIVDGTFSFSSQYGIGGTWNSTGSPQVLVQPPTGDIDEVTFYSGAKDQTFFQANLGRIVNVPEPGTLALASAALVGLLAYAWRKRKI